MAVPWQTSRLQCFQTLGTCTDIFCIFLSAWGCVICLHHKGCVLQFIGILFSALFLITSDKSLPVAPSH